MPFDTEFNHKALYACEKFFVHLDLDPISPFLDGHCLPLCERQETTPIPVKQNKYHPQNFPDYFFSFISSMLNLFKFDKNHLYR